MQGPHIQEIKTQENAPSGIITHDCSFRAFMTLDFVFASIVFGLLRISIEKIIFWLDSAVVSSDLVLYAH